VVLAIIKGHGWGYPAQPAKIKSRLRAALDFGLHAGLETDRNSNAHTFRERIVMASSGDGHSDESMRSDRLKKRLRELERKLETRESERAGLSDEESAKRSSALGKAFQLATELVAGVFVGGLIGWLLDRWLGTLPLFLLVFLLLGIAAGFLNVIRAARGMSEK
jgi:ATP synthase protein I